MLQTYHWKQEVQSHWVESLLLKVCAILVGKFPSKFSYRFYIFDTISGNSVSSNTSKSMYHPRRGETQASSFLCFSHVYSVMVYKGIVFLCLWDGDLLEMQDVCELIFLLKFGLFWGGRMVRKYFPLSEYGAVTK